MSVQRFFAMAIALALSSASWQCSFAQEQSAASTTAAAAPGDSQEAARRQILESDRWRRTFRKFEEWVSVQQVYTEEQLAAVRAELTGRIATMSPRELEVFLKDMEHRLAVLTSPEAEDARHWLSQFLAVARNPEAQLGRSRPDVLNMTAGQIRQELLWLQQHRAARQQSQAAFQQGRALQHQAASQVRDTRRQSQGQAAETRSRSAAEQLRSLYAPRPADRLGHGEIIPPAMGPPIYSVSPWGTPVYWHPMRGQWW
jgi:hypothetical protein